MRLRSEATSFKKSPKNVKTNSEKSDAFIPASPPGQLSATPPSARYATPSWETSCKLSCTAPVSPMKRHEDNKFSRQGWYYSSRKIFLQTTKLVDETTRQLVETARMFHKVPEELREVSLTLAVWDHCIIEYAQAVRNKTSRRQFEWREKVQVQSKCWRHPGGLISLSEILTGALKEGSAILQQLKNLSTFLGFLRAFKLIWITSIAGFLALWKVNFQDEIRATITFIESFTVDLSQLLLSFLQKVNKPPGSSYKIVSWSFRLLLKAYICVLGLLKGLANFGRGWINPKELIPRLYSKFKFMLVPIGLYCYYNRVLLKHRKRLQTVNIRLNMLLQYWHLCMSSIFQSQHRLDRNMFYRASETVKKSGEPCWERWTLGLVAPSSSIRSCFWYKVSWKLKLMKISVNITYATLTLYYEIFGSRYRFFPFGLLIFFYYCLRHEDAELRSNQLLGKPDLRIVAFVWRTLDGSLARFITLVIMPWMGLSPSIPVLMRLKVPVSTKLSQRLRDSFLMDVESRTQFDSSSLEASTCEHDNLRKQMMLNDESSRSMRSISEESNAGETALWTDCHDIGYEPTTASSILFLSANVDDFRLKHVMHLKYPSSLSMAQKRRDVVFFVHGGGFLGNFCASDMRFLSIWTSQVKTPIISVDYRLSPKSSFPCPLVDCYMTYRYVVEGGLGFPVRRIVLVGDSNGCALAVSLTLKLIQDEDEVSLLRPSRVILSCPILNFRSTPTTSRLLFMMDPLVSNNLFNLCRMLYLPSTVSYETNFYVSPLVAASDELLRKFPPCGIVCGGYDPFCDDAVDWAHRLHDVGVQVTLKRYERLPHMFLAFGHIFPEAERAIYLCGKWMQESFRG